MGFNISSPIDVIYDNRYDLLQKANRDKIDQMIEEDDPFLLSMSPVCGPWSSWQNVNMSKSEELYEKIMADRKSWYPVLKWLAGVVRKRIQKGREIVLENPWPSLLWKLRFMEDLYTEPLIHPVTGEPVELCRLGQCMYVLEGESGLPHQKATGMLLSSGEMKKYLTTRCDRSHEHEPLEGGQRTKRAQQWPEDLCFAIMYGAQEELRKQVLKVGFSMEYEQEEREEQGPLDAINNMDDVSEMPWKRRRIDLHELDREEDYEEHKEDELVAQKERDRRQGWLQTTKNQRVAIRRLHTMMGHCSNQALIRLLRASMADKKVITAAQHFRRPSCDEVKKVEQPRETRPLRPDHQLRFNYEVSIDVFEVHDSRGGRHAILSMVDMATRYHIAVRVGGGGTPSSHVCAEALNLAWITPFGAPTVLVSDQGVHNRGKLNSLLQGHGVEVRRTGVQAAFQLGTGECPGWHSEGDDYPGDPQQTTMGSRDDFRTLRRIGTHQECHAEQLWLFPCTMGPWTNSRRCHKPHGTIL